MFQGMRVRKTSWPVVSAVALLASLLGAGDAGASCVSFAGFEHCATGGASLAVTADALEVSGLVQAGEDGVRIHLGDVTRWSGSTRDAGQPGQELTLTSLDGEEPTSTATLRRTAEGTEISAGFTGAANAATFAVTVYEQGAFRGGQGGLPGGGIAVFIRDSEYEDPDEEFGIAPADGGSGGEGACFYVFRTAGSVTFILADGEEIVGDEVRLVEEVAGPGHYPYLTFDGMLIQGSVGELRILAENALGGGE